MAQYKDKFKVKGHYLKNEEVVQQLISSLSFL